MLHPTPSHPFRDGGAGEKRKAKGKRAGGRRRGRGKPQLRPRRRGPAGGARPAGRGSAAGPPPCGAQGRARAVLGFPLAVPEPCRRTLCPPEGSALLGRSGWDPSPPSSPFQRYPAHGDGAVPADELRWLHSKNSTAVSPPSGSRVCLY